VSCVALRHTPPTLDVDTLSLHDALPIYCGHGEAGGCLSVTRPLRVRSSRSRRPPAGARRAPRTAGDARLLRLLRLDGDRPVDDADRKSTRLNSSHVKISYAVFCLKKKNS